MSSTALRVTVSFSVTNRLVRMSSRNAASFCNDDTNFNFQVLATVSPTGNNVGSFSPNFALPNRKTTLEKASNVSSYKEARLMTNRKERGKIKQSIAPRLVSFPILAISLKDQCNYQYTNHI